MSTTPICNIDDIFDDPAFVRVNEERGRFQARFGLLGKALGTGKIGLNVTEVPAGKTAWPRHYHYNNDEMFIVLAGTGVLHYGDDDFPLAEMDVAHIEAGTGIPFQIENTGEVTLRYLALSSLDPADVMVYPDSGKIGIMSLAAPHRNLSGEGLQPFRRWIGQDMEIGYWEGEAGAG